MSEDWYSRAANIPINFNSDERDKREEAEWENFKEKAKNSPEALALIKFTELIELKKYTEVFSYLDSLPNTTLKGIVYTFLIGEFDDFFTYCKSQLSNKGEEK